jgi:hypothetical protein
MGPQQEALLIDTNVFVIDLRYKTDIHHKKNSRVLMISFHPEFFLKTRAFPIQGKLPTLTSCQQIKGFEIRGA